MYVHVLSQLSPTIGVPWDNVIYAIKQYFSTHIDKYIAGVARLDPDKSRKSKTQNFESPPTPL